MHEANENRAEIGRQALQLIEGHDFDPETALADLLTNLRHLAEANGLDFEAALSSSEMHYEGERGEGDDIEESYRETLQA